MFNLTNLTAKGIRFKNPAPGPVRTIGVKYYPAPNIHTRMHSSLETQHGHTREAVRIQKKERALLGLQVRMILIRRRRRTRRRTALSCIKVSKSI